MVRAGLEESGHAELVDVAVLLASELCENAVLHGGTAFEIELTVTAAEATVAVTDQGSGPLELHLARPRSERAATHGRGLQLVQRLAAAWGTRHDRSGHHQTWFTLSTGGQLRRTPRPAAQVNGLPTPVWPPPRTARWLLRVPPDLQDQLDLPVLVAELLRRLCEVLDAAGATAAVDYGDGFGTRELASCGEPAPDVRDGDRHQQLRVRMPLSGPLRGELRLDPGPRGTFGERRGAALELADLVAQRIALVIESDWLRGADQRHRAWLTYLADVSELLGQSLDVELTVAVVPQLVVPRLGQWCAVHLLDGHGGPRLAALAHADENVIGSLRAGLDAAAVRDQLATVLRRPASPASLAGSAEGMVVALTRRGQPFGTLAVGRPPDRPHLPEEVALIADLARRASLAIDNAQTTAQHVQTSQALQQALLPRRLPVAPEVEFAAEYLPASTGSDVGGDFYDVLDVGSGRWLTSIGDVCGKGARAAARTGLVRDVLRVLVNDGRSPQRAVQLLNEVMMEADDPQQFCTLATAMISRSTGDQPPGLAVELVLAGHERPVLVRADGSVELIGEHCTAVGLVRDVTPTCTRHWLHPGDAMVAYTDGVTELRRGHEQFGQQRLLEVLAAASGEPAANLVLALRLAVEGFSRHPRRDDIAVLVVRAAAR